MVKRVNISEARSRLFELVDYVSATEGGVVLIEHRGRAERAVLVSEAHLHYLETSLKELKRQTAKPFKLAGSIDSPLTDDALEAALKEDRREQVRLVATKLEDL